MKLKDWADKQGISYLTAWRWFKAGDPRLSNAYQSDSGTIIVPEDFDAPEISMAIPQSNDVMSLVLKKTVELSKNNASIEDFAAWVLSNFSLKLNTINEAPKYSRAKPKSEEVQKHFQQFLKPKGEKPKANMFVTTDLEALDELMIRSDDLTAQELVAEIHKVGASVGVSVNPNDAPEVEELYKDLSSAVSIPDNFMMNGVKTYGDITEGVVTRSVDLTPQQLNYTGSAHPAFGNVSFTTNQGIDSLRVNGSCPITGTVSSCYVSATPAVTLQSNFKPTLKELESLNKVSEIAERPRRGRKRSKITGNE